MDPLSITSTVAAAYNVAAKATAKLDSMRGKHEKGKGREHVPNPATISIDRPGRGYCLRPAQLYNQRATPSDHQTHGSPGKLLGVLEQTLIIWQISGAAKEFVDENKVLRLFGPHAEVLLIEEVRYVMIGQTRNMHMSQPCLLVRTRETGRSFWNKQAKSLMREFN